MATRIVYQVPDKGYADRLRRILRSEEYGPKLVRLNISEQQQILQLINANQGKQARTRILELDEQRRARRRTHNAIAERAKAYAGASDAERHNRARWRDERDWAHEQDADHEFWRIYSGQRA